MKLLHRERNIVLKRRYSFRIALLFPSTYEASISSLGYQILYYYLNNFEDVFAERVVARDKELLSIETGTPLKKFDVILATAHYELDYIELVRAILRAGIEPLSERRNSPPLIIGGPSITAWPYPMSRIADAAFLGEFEASGREFVNTLFSLDKYNKKPFIEELASVKGFWHPSKEKKEIVRVRDLDSSYHPIAQIQSEDAEPVWGRSYMAEISRGCNWGCLFCLESAVSGVRRERSFSVLKNLIEKGVEANDVDKVTFFSLSFFDTDLGERILNLLIEMGLKGSVPSIRIETLSDERAELIKKIGQKTVAIAPETGKDDLRWKIGKRIDSQQIFNAVSYLAKHDLSVKLYYMFGLPGEKKEDLDNIVEQVKEIKKIIGSRNKIKVSANPFIPKPLTPLWKYEMLPLRELKERANYLRSSLSQYAEVEIYEPRMARKQYEINIKGVDADIMIIGEAMKNLERDE